MMDSVDETYDGATKELFLAYPLCVEVFWEYGFTERMKEDG